MTVNIDKSLDLNITDFLLLQEISEMKLDRFLGTVRDLNDNIINANFYTNYVNYTQNNSTLSLTQIKNQFYTAVGATPNIDNDTSTAYIGGAGAYTKISQTQADYFLDNFKILDYYGNDNTGFSATTFIKNSDIALVNGENKLKEITISFRSTEFKEDYYKDAYGADTEINDSGTAIAQNIALVNYLEKLKSNGIITANTRINITGYSLGGHLASSAYQYLKYDNYDIKQLYVFNGPGVGNVLNPGTLDHTVKTNNFGLLKDDLLNYSKILDMFQSLATQNIATKQDTLTFINLNSTYQIVYDFFNNMDTDLLETTLFLNKNGSLLKTSGLSIYNNDNSYSEHENEISRDINIQNNDDSAYLSKTIYNSVIYKKFKDFIINKYGMTKASTGGDAITNTATEEENFIVAAQSEKTGVFSPNLFGLNSLWLNGQASVNNYDYLSNDFNFVANSNRYGPNVDIIIEDRPETEDELARVPIAENFTKYLNGDFGNTHSITLLNKTLNLMVTLAKLEGKSSINVSKYSALISSSSKERASHFYSKSDGNMGTGDYNAVANIINTLSNLLLTSQGKPQVMFDNTLGGWANIDKLNQLDEIESKLIQTKISNLNFISLYNIKSSDLSRAEFNTTQYDYISKTELISKAKSNIAYRYALDYLNTFVVEGLDYSNYSNSIDTSHSEQWYSSRADILLKIIDSNVGNLNNYISSGYNDNKITGDSNNVYVNDKKQDVVFISNNINLNFQKTVYNSNSYYAQSQSFNSVSSLDSKLLSTIGKVAGNVVYNNPLGFTISTITLLGVAALTAPLIVPASFAGGIVVGGMAGLNAIKNYNDTNLPANSGSNSITLFNYFNKIFRGSDLQKYIDNLSYRTSVSLYRNIYFLDNYMSNYQTNNSKNKNENVFINVDKQLLFNYINNPQTTNDFKNTPYTYKEGLSSAQTIDDIDIRHNVHLGDGSDYLEITDDGISNVFSTSGKKNYYLKGTKTYITDPEKSGTITLDGILLDGGKMIVENGFVDISKRVQTFQSNTELDDLGNPKEYKITYEFKLVNLTRLYVITNEQTGHEVILNKMTNFGNGQAFGFKDLASHSFIGEKTFSQEDLSNDFSYNPSIGYINKVINGYYDGNVDVEELANISVGISNENIVATRNPDNLKDLIIYDKTSPSNMHTIANFFDELGGLKEHIYYVFNGDNYTAQHLHYKINHTELNTILNYNPTMISPGISETFDPIQQDQGYTSYELYLELNTVLNYTPYARYFLNNSLIESTGFRREGNDLILYTLDYEISQAFSSSNGTVATGTNIIKNYFAFDHSTNTNFYVHRYGQNIALTPNDLVRRMTIRLDENSSEYIMDENSYKTVVSGAGNDKVVGTQDSETFISGTATDWDIIMGTPYSDGNDTFTGGGGADIYSFSGNFGYDTITDFNNESIIYINNAYEMSEYQFLKQGNDLIIYKENDADVLYERNQLIVKNYFTNIDYQNNSRIVFTRVQEHYTELYSDPNYVPETYYNFNSSDIESFNTTDISKTSDEVIEQTAKDNSNNSVDTSKLSSSHIKGNDLDNTIIIRNNDTVIHSNQTTDLTDGDDTYIIDIASTEAIPQNHNNYRTTIEFGFNSGHDLLLNATFKQIAQYGDIIDLKDIDSSALTVNALKDENNVTVGFNLILQDGSSLLISVNDLSDTNVAMVKTNNGILTLNNLISMSSPTMIIGDSMNNSFDLSSSIKTVSINGLDGNDVIVGGQADDTIEGGRGFDNFTFSKGYDTYRFGANSEIDKFDMKDLTANDILAISAKFLVDTSYKTNGVSYAYNAEENEGYLKLSSSDGIIFSNVSWSNFVLLINNINVEFTDGYIPEMNVDYTNTFPFVNAVKIVSGTTGTDYIQTNAVYSNVIYGKEGNDTIVSSGNGNNTRNFLIGGKGSDTITANDGDFVLVKDGDGTDTIKTTDRTFVLEILHSTPRLVNNQETIFDVSAVSGTNDIKLKYGGTNDTVTIKDYFASNNNEITIALYDKTSDRTFVYDNLADILSGMGLTKSYLLSHGAQTIYKNNTEEDMVSSVGQVIGGEIAYQYLNGNYLTDQNKINHIVDNQLNGQPFQNKIYS